jgi:putative transcriptional regulator
MKKKSTALTVIANATKTAEFTPAAIRNIMKKLDVNERGLALLLNVVPRTVRCWLSGATRPSGLSCRLMQIYAAREDVADIIAANVQIK